MPIDVAKLEIRRNLTGEHIGHPKNARPSPIRSHGGGTACCRRSALDVPDKVQLCFRCREEGHNGCLC
jgi:hypothetical protein